MKNKKLVTWSLTVALAGFLFGFDTVVISGADLALQQLWDRGAIFHGFVIISSALWGAVLGAVFGGIPCDRLGRKRTLFWIGVLYFVSAVGAALATGPWVFAIFRFIGGLGVGASTVAAPAYVSEISPPKDRGKLVALYQFNIVFGILIAFISNYLLSSIEVDAWRWMIGVEAVPAFFYTIFVLTIPNSPRWLIVHRQDHSKAIKTLQIISPNEDPQQLLANILQEQSGIVSQETIFSRKYRFPLLLAFLISFFNQFSGINAFLYYAPRIFEIAGLGESTSLLSSIGIGLTNMIFTLLGLSLIDRIGRKQLMYLGSVGYIFSLCLVAMAFHFSWTGMTVPFFLFLFIASHAIGQGTVIWVFISEIFPNHLRAQGQAFGSSTHWVLAAAIPSVVPLLFVQIGAAPVFGFFAFMMVLQLIFVFRMMPETKGVALEELQKQLLVRESAKD